MIDEALFGNERPRAFVEARVKECLASLSSRRRSVFAWSCSARLLPGYLKWHEQVGTQPSVSAADLLASIQEKLRNCSEEVTHSEFAEKVEALIELSPTDNSPWSPSTPIAEDAVASLAYTLRAMVSGDPQEATWAARRAYEAADQLAVFDLSQEYSDFPPESKLLAHSAVQTELARQEHDFGVLVHGNVAAVLDAGPARSIFDY